MKQWEAVVFPLSLTSLMYTGSFVLKFFSLWSSWAENVDHRIDLSFDGLKSVLQKLINSLLSFVYNISAWRIYIVVSYFIFFFIIFFERSPIFVYMIFLNVLLGPFVVLFKCLQFGRLSTV